MTDYDDLFSKRIIRKAQQGTDIIIKFKELGVPYEDSLETQFGTLGLSGLAEIFNEYPNMTVQRLVASVTPEDIKKLEEYAQSNRKKYFVQGNGNEKSSILSFFRVTVPVDVKVDEVIEKLRKDESIEKVYLEGIIKDAHLDSTLKDPKMGDQGYLDKHPIGIDAFAAWKVKGGCGAGIIFIDIETGWKIDHEDLRSMQVKSLPKNETVDPDSHGTKVLGVVVGLGHNNKGVIGIAHETEEVILCSKLKHSIPDCIFSAIDELIKKGRKGDVLLLEVQLGREMAKDHYILHPVEVQDDIRTAIQTAILNDIVVIEAAGNGWEQLIITKNAKGIKEEKWINQGIGINLDELTGENKGRVINRDRKNEFEDSGAIMVAACTSSLPHRKMPFSNYGNRIDCFAWGENVVTTSIDEKNNNKDKYESNFSGTSSASAIIAGAAICIQGIFKNMRKDTLTSIQMRDLLSKDKGASQLFKIGAMPDLQKIITKSLALY